MKTMAGYQRVCVKYKEPTRVQSSGRSSEVEHVESASIWFKFAIVLLTKSCVK